MESEPAVASAPMAGPVAPDAVMPVDAVMPPDAAMPAAPVVAADAVPPPIKTAILLTVAALYDHRGADAAPTPDQALALLAPYRNIRI